ncbi:MAG: T9SS type A sorting domain-containing protein [Bacteroidota bacterium]
MLPQLLPTKLSRLVLALVATCALAAAPHAQVVIEDFDDGIGPGEFIFQGGGTPLLSFVDLGGGDFSARFEVDADATGGFAGFGSPFPGAPLDFTGLTYPVLVFDAKAEGTFQLEINFQNTGGGGNGEIRNNLQFQLGAGNQEAGFTTYQLPLSTFFTTNAASFEFDDVFQYVFTIAGGPDLVGDGNATTYDTSIELNNIRIADGLILDTQDEVVDFNSGDYTDFFFFAGGEGIVATTTTDTPDGSANGFSGSLDGDDFGGFAGFGRTLVGSPLDVTGSETVNFFLRANGPATLEFNLQTVAGNGNNEGRERIQVADTGGNWVPVSIPLAALVRSGASPPDFSQVVNFVATIVGLAGDGDPNTTEFTFELDQIGFGGSQVIPVELLGFDVSLDGTDAVLAWRTASETNNSGFEVQARRPRAERFEVLDFVPGFGTTTEAQAYAFRVSDLEPGTYTFRLRQLDFDGGFEMLPEVEVTVAVPGTHWVAEAYPNPFGSAVGALDATVEFAVAHSTPVRAVLYDVLGRPVQTVFDGTPAANTPIRARVAGHNLASGTYVLVVTGEGFRDTQRVTVTR